MRRTLIFVTILLVLCASGFAQQAPGEHDKKMQTPGRWQAQPPAEHSNTAQKDAEINRLKALVEMQAKKIQLLEQKVKLLEIEQEKSKGVSQ